MSDILIKYDRSPSLPDMSGLIDSIEIINSGDLDLKHHIPKSKITSKFLTIRPHDFDNKSSNIIKASPFFKSNFLNITKSLTLQDCCFDNESFATERWGTDSIFRNIKYLNINGHNCRYVPQDLETILKLTPYLKEVYFEYDTAPFNIDLLKTILKYKNINKIEYARRWQIRDIK